jgi:hypothetical protein
MNAHHPNLEARGNAAALGAADWLCLAAAPTFAMAALLTAVFGGGSPDILCSAAQDGSPLSGMVPMYLLMSAFHSAPWLKLISNRRSRALEIQLTSTGGDHAQQQSGLTRGMAEGAP